MFSIATKKPTSRWKMHIASKDKRNLLSYTFMNEKEACQEIEVFLKQLEKSCSSV